MFVYKEVSPNMSSPPDYIKLNITSDQERQGTLYQYEYKGVTTDEKDLEEKVGGCCHLLDIFSIFSYLEYTCFFHLFLMFPFQQYYILSKFIM